MDERLALEKLFGDSISSASLWGYYSGLDQTFMKELLKSAAHWGTLLPRYPGVPRLPFSTSFARSKWKNLESVKCAAEAGPSAVHLPCQTWPVARACVCVCVALSGPSCG